jgi:hypothetical protein
MLVGPFAALRQETNERTDHGSVSKVSKLSAALLKLKDTVKEAKSGPPNKKLTSLSHPSGEGHVGILVLCKPLMFVAASRLFG